MTQEELKQHLYYDKETGEFTRLYTKSNRIKPNTKAGYIQNKGYIAIKINNKAYLAHRLAWLYVYGEFPKEEIDHINRNKEDNRISNLREADRELNNRNIGLSKNNTSGVTGVNFRRDINKWVARIHAKGKRILVGSFNSLDDAIKARKNAEIQYGYPTTVQA